MKPNPLLIWARSSINRVGTAVVRVCDLWSGRGAQVNVLWTRCQLTALQVPLLWWLLPDGESFGQTSCLLLVHISTWRATLTMSNHSARGWASSIAFISISVILFMGFHCLCAPVWQGCLDSKGFRQQMKTVPCLIWKLFWEVSNTKYWLDSVNHSHYSCLFSTVSPRFNHPLYWGRQLQDEPFPSTVASGPSVSYYFCRKLSHQWNNQRVQNYTNSTLWQRNAGGQKEKCWYRGYHMQRNQKTQHSW